MKARSFWLIVLAAALVAAVVYVTRQKTLTTAPDGKTGSASGANPGGAGATAKPKTEVPIEDGKTIDFTGGVPVVKDSASEKAAMDRALKEMADATKNVTFPPSAAVPGSQPPAAPAPAQKP